MMTLPPSGATVEGIGHSLAEGGGDVFILQDEFATLCGQWGKGNGSQENFQADIAQFLKWYDGGDYSKTNVATQFHVPNVNMSLLAWTQTATAAQFQNSPMNNCGMRERCVTYHTQRVCICLYHQPPKLALWRGYPNCCILM
jgi:hypothetical protein